MTVKELYEEMSRQGKEDYEIVVACGDRECGYMKDEDECLLLETDDEKKTVKL